MDEKTCCNNKWSFVERWDDRNTGICFNLYICDDCGAVKKSMIWKNPGHSYCKAEDTLQNTSDNADLQSALAEVDKLQKQISEIKKQESNSEIWSE